MKKLLALGLALALGLSMAACGDGGKGAADVAIKGALTAFDAVKSDALTYVPDQAKSVQDAIAAVQVTFEKGNYTQALTDAQALSARIAALSEASAAKRAELNKSWTAMAEGLPKVAEVIKARMDILAKAKKLPAKLTKESYDTAKTSYEAMNTAWTQANDAFKGGDLVGAVARATSAKEMAAKTMTALGMELPPALQ